MFAMEKTKFHRIHTELLSYVYIWDSKATIERYSLRANMIVLPPKVLYPKML